MATFGTVEVFDRGQPEIRYSSGLTIFTEQFRQGQLVGSYWSAGGRIKADDQVPAWDLGVPAQSFDLNLDGQSLHNEWEYGKAEQRETKAAVQGTVALRHRVRPVRLKVHTRLDGTPFLTRWLEITNTGKTPAALSAVSPWCGVLCPAKANLVSPAGTPDYEHTPFTLGRFAAGGWGQEGRFIWQSLVSGVAAHLKMHGPYGTSGYECPWFLLRNETSGECFAGYLAWSGPWSIEILCDNTIDNIVHFSISPAARPPLRLIEPGETLATPAVHLGLMRGDLDHVVQAAHEHIRRSVLPDRARKAKPMVEYSHFGYIGLSGITQERLLEDVDLAAAVGAEVYVIDAGWYGKGPADQRNDSMYARFMGDWVAGEWLPNDLDPIVRRVRQKKMKFGLWVEPEGIGLHSEIHKKRPDWIVRLNGRPAPDRYKCERLNLDFTNPAAARWLEGELVRLVRRYRLDILRIDGGPMYVQVGERRIGHYVENTAWRHYEALYGVLDRVRQKFPKLWIENCCGGGSRMDLGMLGRTDWTQITDEWEPPRIVQIVNGVSLMLPPETLAQIQRLPHLQHEDMDLVLRSSLFGRFYITGAAPSRKNANPEFLKKLRRYIDLYKTKVAPILSESKVYHHTPVIRLNAAPENAFCAIELASSDRAVVLAGVFKLNNAGKTYHLRPRGLDLAKRYRVTFDNEGQSVQMEGLRLAQEGIKIDLESPLTSQLLIFEAKRG